MFGPTVTEKGVEKGSGVRSGSTSRCLLSLSSFSGDDDEMQALPTFLRPQLMLPEINKYFIVFVARKHMYARVHEL
jgi:hypothetical protein